MDRAAGAGVVGVSVHVGIDPDQADATAKAVVGAAPGADGAGVVAAQHRETVAGQHGVLDLAGQALAQARDQFRRRCGKAGGAGELQRPIHAQAELGEAHVETGLLEGNGTVGRAVILGAHAPGGTI